MQGGGVLIDGSANFNGCNIFNNEAQSVRARIFELLDSSSSAPLTSIPVSCARRLVGFICLAR